MGSSFVVITIFSSFVFPAFVFHRLDRPSGSLLVLGTALLFLSVRSLVLVTVFVGLALIGLDWTSLDRSTTASIEWVTLSVRWSLGRSIKSVENRLAQSIVFCCLPILSPLFSSFFPSSLNSFSSFLPPLILLSSLSSFPRLPFHPQNLGISREIKAISRSPNPPPPPSQLFRRDDSSAS